MSYVSVQNWGVKGVQGRKPMTGCGVSPPLPLLSCSPTTNGRGMSEAGTVGLGQVAYSIWMLI